MNRVRESEQTDPLAEAPFEGPYREVVPLGETFAATTECGLQLLDRALVCFVGVYGAVTACEEVPGFGARVHMQRANVIVERLTVINPSTEAEREELERQLDRLHAAVLHRLAELGCTRISNHRDPATRRTST
jgi:hypothetical protein